MDAIQIDGHEIKRGNFQAFAEILGSNALAGIFYDMEKYYFTDRARFAGNMRLAIEAFVAEEYLRLHPEDADDLWNRMHLTLQAEKRNNQQAAELNGDVKVFLALRCCRQEYLPYFDAALDHYRAWARQHAPWSLGGLNSPRGVRRLITQMYAFGSSSHHADSIGAKTQDVYAVTEENCRIFCRIFYHFLRAYCLIYFPGAGDRMKASFDEQLCPLGDYIPLSGGNLKAIGLQKIKGKRFFIREKEGKIQYFLLCDIDRDRQYSREVEVLRNIWADDNDYEPNNIIRFREEISINEADKKLVFALPSKPARLTPGILEGLTPAMKEKIFHDALRAIASLHRNIPSYYHRDITPEAFNLCSTRSGYKLFLNMFDCVKDTDENAVMTVGTVVANNRAVARKIPYIAPEILALQKDSREWKNADWEKADIYALGMLGVLIFTGGTDLQAFLNAPDVEEQIKIRIGSMCAPVETRMAHI